MINHDLKYDALRFVLTDDKLTSRQFFKLVDRLETEDRERLLLSPDVQKKFFHHGLSSVVEGSNVER